jgi:hypothetical protein
MAIVSASRRTDIPAFYSEWFISRIHEGYVLYPLPHSDKLKYLELTPENIDCIVFWSKNYERLMQYLDMLDNRGYEYYFHFTVNNYPEYLEQNIIKVSEAIDQFKRLAEHKSPDHVLWRYDPIITTKDLNINFHLYNFENIAYKLKDYTRRCYIEFLDIYRKVERNFDRKQIHSLPLSQGQKETLVKGLASIAAQYNMDVFACCDDTLVSETVKKAHCIDYELIEKLTGKKINFNFAPTRNDCGCAKSIDIGEYGSCLHGCLYCYACETISEAQNFYQTHKASSPALDPLKLNKFDNQNLFKHTRNDDGQLKLF